MRLQRIYSSKLYVTSTRKDKIHAAIQDPINAELVQQLEEYLSDDAKVELKRAIKEETAELESAQAEVAQNDTSNTQSGGNSSFTPSSGGAHSSFTGDIASDFGEDELSDIEPLDIDDGGDTSIETPEEPEPVESVTQEGRPITSATIIYWNSLDDVISDCNTIKGTLNAREDTAGVIRIEVKDNELWLYFNDDSNLNDKMVEVISVLNSTGYTYLKFNRLARSNNAIVFDINLNLSEDVKSAKDIEEETK